MVTELALKLATVLATCTGFDPDSVGEEIHKLIPSLTLPDDHEERTAILITLSNHVVNPNSLHWLSMSHGEIFPVEN